MKLPIYETNTTNSHRYALGSLQGRTLYVVGVNPSTASDTRLDPTVTNVKSFSELLGFDSFLMLNLYPQRSTDPNGLHRRMSGQAHGENLRVIGRMVRERATIWAAWGNLITHRPYLVRCLREISEVLEDRSMTWIQYDQPTKEGHPKHPARKKHVNVFRPFELGPYLGFLGS